MSKKRRPKIENRRGMRVEIETETYQPILDRASKRRTNVRK